MAHLSLGQLSAYWFPDVEQKHGFISSTYRVRVLLRRQVNSKMVQRSLLLSWTAKGLPPGNITNVRAHAEHTLTCTKPQFNFSQTSMGVPCDYPPISPRPNHKAINKLWKNIWDTRDKAKQPVLTLVLLADLLARLCACTCWNTDMKSGCSNQKTKRGGAGTVAQR